MKCDCGSQIIDAAISTNGIRLTCDCGNPQSADAETLKILEVIGAYLRR